MALAKLDLRLEEELLEKVRAIARDNFGAKINHISGKPETTPTLIQLIQYGITYLESNPDVIGKTRLIPMTPDNIPDSVLDSIVEKVSALSQDNYQDVLHRLSRLEEESNKDTYQDTYQEALKKIDELGESLETRLSQLREKEIVPILSRLENLEATPPDFDLEVDPPDYSPIFTDPDPIPISELEQKIRDYILENTGKEVISSNLFRGLDLTNKPAQQQNAKNILERLGCVEIKIQGRTRPQLGWKIP